MNSRIQICFNLQTSLCDIEITNLLNVIELSMALNLGGGGLIKKNLYPQKIDNLFNYLVGNKCNFI